MRVKRIILVAAILLLSIMSGCRAKKNDSMEATGMTKADTQTVTIPIQKSEGETTTPFYRDDEETAYIPRDITEESKAVERDHEQFEIIPSVTEIPQATETIPPVTEIPQATETIPSVTEIPQAAESFPSTTQFLSEDNWETPDY